METIQAYLLGGEDEDPAPEPETSSDPLATNKPFFTMKDGKFCCTRCNNLFTQKTNLQRHVRKVHKETTTSNARTSCIRPGCKEMFYHKTKLMQHLEEDHGICLQKSELSFATVEKFLAWKEREESQNFAYFSKERGAIQSSLCIHQTYACQRNGSSRSHKAKGSPARTTSRKKSQGCVKTDMICPARIITAKCLKTGNLKVTYYSSHSHRLLSSDIKFHPLPQKLRDDLKLKIAFGVTVEDILKDLSRPNHSNIGNLTVFKKQLNISRHHMQQMRRNIFKRAEKNPEGLDSISGLAILLEKHRAEGHNPIMMYKPEGGQYIIGKLEGDSLAVEDSPVVVGVQTKQQLHMLQLFTVKYLCVESVQYQNYLLVNVSMRDDYGRGSPVAHLICSPDDQAALFYFFQIIAESFNKSMMAGVLTDESSSCINILLAVFGENLSHVFCKRLVHHDWLHQLQVLVADKELRREIYTSLVLLMEETNLNQFTSMTSTFLNRYQSKDKSFVVYFKESYLDRCPQWATCYGNYSSDPNHTTMYDEAFHKPLKAYLDSESKEGEIYDLVAFLVKTADEHSDQSLLQSCLQPTQTVGLRSRHEEALQIPLECVTRMMAKMYSVKTETELLHVKRVKKFCPEASCSPQCLHVSCVELCPHLYTCTCGEESHLCPHIHRVHMQMQSSFLVNIKMQLTDPTRKSSTSSAPLPPPQKKLRRSPRQAQKEAAIQAKESVASSNESEGTGKNGKDAAIPKGDAADDDDDDDDDDGDDGDDGGLFMANTYEPEDNNAQDPGLIFNAEPVPIEDDETSEVNLTKILDVNDELLALLENKKVQASLFPYILSELKAIVAKCKAQVPADSLDNLWRRAKRKAATPLPLLQIKMRETAVIKKALESKLTSGQENSVEQGRVLEGGGTQVTKPEATLPQAPAAATNSSAGFKDLLSYIITSAAQTQPGNAVYMVPGTATSTMPSSCEGIIPSTALTQVRENSPVQIIMNAPATSHIQTLHTASSTSGISEPSPLEAEAMQPLVTPLQQTQRHLFPPATAPSGMIDFSSLSSQLVSSLPPALSSATQHHSQQESEYIPRQPSLTPAGSVLSQTIVTQIVQRAAPSPYPYKEHSQSLPLTGTNQQTGMTASYLASQLGHHMMPPQPLAQHLPSPYTFTGTGQPLSHQPAHSLPQPRQYLPPTNQTLQPLQPSPFMSTIQPQPLHHLTPNPSTSQGQHLHQTDPNFKATTHPMY
ncbi:uncharacterized protein LOC115924911 [Strongylocentrotus purpuratus]|uniref:C2H2-type domain-containing protein n=1 Tax=Strongylocentrotus purpuratus TaxID=7668 RepID=A0A7M7P455_STRPU|nr:uncharacterized protein LOC115924911 [Strongylocentrotus purpuratus]